MMRARLLLRVRYWMARQRNERYRASSLVFRCVGWEFMASLHRWSEESGGRECFLGLTQQAYDEENVICSWGLEHGSLVPSIHTIGLDRTSHVCDTADIYRQRFIHITYCGGYSDKTVLNGLISWTIVIHHDFSPSSIGKCWQFVHCAQRLCIRRMLSNHKDNRET